MKLPLKQAVAGFTLIEMLVIIAIIGIIAGMAAPNWLAWLTRQRVNSAQAEALTALREGQANAKREKRVWAACFRDDPVEKKVKWSVNPVPDPDNWDCSKAVNWKNILEENADQIGIDTANSNLVESPGGYYTVQYQYSGMVNGSKYVGDADKGKKITFVARNQASNSKRCIYLETILGALRADSNDECKK